VHISDMFRIFDIPIVLNGCAGCYYGRHPTDGWQKFGGTRKESILPFRMTQRLVAAAYMAGLVSYWIFIIPWDTYFFGSMGVWEIVIFHLMFLGGALSAMAVVWHGPCYVTRESADLFHPSSYFDSIY
jgi:hypothetical protein